MHGGGSGDGGGGVRLETLFIISLIAQLASLIPAGLLACTAGMGGGGGGGRGRHHETQQGRLPKPPPLSSSSLSSSSSSSPLPLSSSPLPLPPSNRLDGGWRKNHNGGGGGCCGRGSSCGAACWAAWGTLQALGTLLTTLASPPGVWLWCLWSLG